MLHSAIIDNTALIYLSLLKKNFNAFEKLRLIFSKLHVPQEVLNEFYRGSKNDPEREYVLSHVRPENNFFTLCTHYDSVIREMLQGFKGIDIGEAEAVAQRLKVNATYIISDDVPFKNAIEKYDSSLIVINTLHLVAILDLHYYIPDYHKTIAELHKVRPFTSSQMRQAYIEAASMYSLSVSKKQLSLKCSLSKILK